MTTETASNQQADASTAFLRAARAGQIDKIISLLEQGVDINVSNANGLNAIHLASKDGHVDVVKELLNRGAAIDAATKKGNTALHIASLAGQEAVVKLLVQNGAEVNVQSQNGFTPLYMAAQENHDGVVKFLLSSGANQGLATEDGFTPLAVAMQQGHDKVVTVLLEADTKGKVRLPALHIAAKKDDIKAATLLLENEHNPDVTSKSGFTPLHIAAHYGNEAVAKLLLAKGADVNCPAKHNICPLHVAAKWGKNNMVLLLCDNGANVESRTRDGLTPLHCAARSGHDRVVETLLARSAPITSKSKNGLSPLHMAAQGEHVEAARTLIMARAPVDDVTVDYLTPLHVAAHTGHHRVAKLLLDRNAESNARALNGFTPLHIACKKNRIKVVELLLKYGASIQATTESGLTPLHVAAFMGCMNIVIYLLQHEASPDVPTVRGETPLHLASRANQTDIIRILLRNGASVDAKAREKQTPLHIASRLGNVDIVVLLLQHGADVRSTTADMHNALHIAAKHHNHEVAAALIEHGAPLSATTKKGFTPLHLAAKYGNIKVANLLLSHGASPDVAGKSGMTPLHVAAQYDKQAVATALLEKGADAKAVAKNGHTPLHIASRKNQIETAAALMEYGAVTNAESKAGFTPLHLAAQQGHTEMCSLLLEHGADVNQQAKNGLSALHLAAQEDRVPVAQLLVKNGAELDIETNGGYTPLHVASHFGQANMTRFLLENDASVKAQTSHGYTALHHAAQQGHINIVNILLEHKADANAATNNGQTPLDIASKLGYVTIMETLKGVSEVPQGPISQDKYKVVAPEGMLETFCSDSEEEAGDELALNDQPYRYLTADDMKSLGDDSLPIDVTRDERAESVLSHKNVMESSTGSANGIAYAPQEVVVKNRFSTAAAPEGYCYNVDPSQPNFLVSFVVDARGGAWRGARGAGVRLIVPPSAARQPSRLTCRYLKPSRINHMPPLMEGEALAARVLEMGPVAAKFLGPVILEVPHYASLRGKEREIVILRSDNGTSWREHSSDSSLDQVQDLLNETIEIEEPPNEEVPGTPNPRVVRILTHDFPQYFAVISRIRQEVHAIGPEGGMVSSSVVPQVQAVFPQGALTKKIKVGLQAQIIDSELTAKLLGRGVAVSPVVTVEPRRRKFHKAITLSMPAPRPHTQGMTNQYSTSSAPTLRLLCSISGVFRKRSLEGGTNRAHWEDVTENTPLTFVNDCVSFTTTVSARYWLIDCRHVEDATKMATDLYKEAIHVPFMARFIVYTRRTEEQQAQLRMFCVTDDKEDKTLERIEKFSQVAKSRDVEVHEGKPCYLEFAGNLVPIAKSGEQLAVPFKAFRENRLAFPVMVKSAHADPIARCLFMREPKVAKGDPTPAPICVLNIVIPEEVVEIQLEKTSPQVIAPRNAEQELLWKQRLSDPSLEEICTLLGKDWVALAYELGVGVATVNQIQAKRISTVEQAQLMLKLWRTQSGTKSQDNSLELALCRIGRDDIIAPQSEVINERRIQRNIYQERQASEEIEAYKAEDDNKLADRRNYDDVQISRISERSRESEHDQDEAKYSPEEKSFYEKSEIERTPTPSEESEDEGIKHSVAERKEQITKKLSTTKIPASKQKKEIREEIIEIKTQIKPDIKKFQDIEQQVMEKEPKLERTRSKPSPDTSEELTKATVEKEIAIKKETQVIIEKTSDSIGKYDPSSPAKPTPKHLQRHVRNESMRFPSGDFSNVTITPRKVSVDRGEAKILDSDIDITTTSISETVSQKEIFSSKVEEKSYDGDKSPDLVIEKEKDVTESSLKDKITSFESKLSKESSLESSSTGTTVKLTKEALKQHTMAQDQSLEYTQEFVREQFKMNKEEEKVETEVLKSTDALTSVKDAIQQFDTKAKVDAKKVKSVPAAMRTDSTLVQVSSEEDAEFLKKSTDSETEVETQVVKTEKVSKLRKGLPSLDKDKLFKNKDTKQDSAKENKKPDDDDKKGSSKIPIKVQKSTSKGKVSEVKESFERKISGSESSKSEISPNDSKPIEASKTEGVSKISPTLPKPTELEINTETELSKTKEQVEDFLKYETEYSAQFCAPADVVKTTSEPQLETSPVISAKARQFIETVPEDDSVQECFFSKRIYSDSLEDSEQSDSRRHSEADSLKSDQSDIKVKVSSSDFDERAEYDEVIDSGSGFGDEKFEESVGFTSLKLDTVGVDVERSDTDLDKTEDSGEVVFKKVHPKRHSRTESTSITKLSDLQQEDKSKQEFQVVVTEAEEVSHYFDKDELSDKISSESSREIEISDRKSSEGVSDKISSEDAVTEKKTSSEEDPIKETEKFLELEKVATVSAKVISKTVETRTSLNKDDTFERVDVLKRQSVGSTGSGVELRFDEKRLSDAHSLTESRDYTFEESEDDIRTHEPHVDKEKLEKVEDIVAAGKVDISKARLTHGDSLDDVEGFPEDHIEHLPKLPLIAEAGPTHDIGILDESTTKTTHHQKVEIKDSPTFMTREVETVYSIQKSTEPRVMSEVKSIIKDVKSSLVEEHIETKKEGSSKFDISKLRTDTLTKFSGLPSDTDKSTKFAPKDDDLQEVQEITKEQIEPVIDDIIQKGTAVAAIKSPERASKEAVESKYDAKAPFKEERRHSCISPAVSLERIAESDVETDEDIPKYPSKTITETIKGEVVSELKKSDSTMKQMADNIEIIIKQASEEIDLSADEPCYTQEVEQQRQDITNNVSVDSIIEEAITTVEGYMDTEFESKTKMIAAKKEAVFEETKKFSRDRPALMKSLSRDSGEVVILPKKKHPRTFSVQSSPEEIEEHIYTDSESDMDKAKVLEIIEPSSDGKVSAHFDTLKLKTDSLDDADELFAEKEPEDFAGDQKCNETLTGEFIKQDEFKTSLKESTEGNKIDKIEQSTHVDSTKKLEFTSSTTEESMTTIVSTLTKSSEVEQKSVIEEATSADFSKMSEAELLKDSSRTSIENKDDFKYDDEGTPEMSKKSLDLTKDYSKSSVDSKDTSRDFATNELSKDSTIDLTRDYSKASIESVRDVNKSIEEKTYSEDHSSLDVSKTLASEATDYVQDDSKVSKSSSRETSVMAESKTFAHEEVTEEFKSKQDINDDETNTEENAETLDMSELNRRCSSLLEDVQGAQIRIDSSHVTQDFVSKFSKTPPPSPIDLIMKERAKMEQATTGDISTGLQLKSSDTLCIDASRLSPRASSGGDSLISETDAHHSGLPEASEVQSAVTSTKSPSKPLADSSSLVDQPTVTSGAIELVDRTIEKSIDVIDQIKKEQIAVKLEEMQKSSKADVFYSQSTVETSTSSSSVHKTVGGSTSDIKFESIDPAAVILAMTDNAAAVDEYSTILSHKETATRKISGQEFFTQTKQVSSDEDSLKIKTETSHEVRGQEQETKEKTTIRKDGDQTETSENKLEKAHEAIAIRSDIETKTVYKSNDDTDIVKVEREFSEQGLYSGRQTKSEEKMTVISDETIKKKHEIKISERDLSREQWGKEYFTEPGELEHILEDEDSRSKVAFVDSTVKIVEKDEVIAHEEVSRKGQVISSKVEHRKEESTVESQEHDDLSSDASHAPSFKSETAECKEHSVESSPKSKSRAFKKENEVYEVGFIKEIKVSTSPVKSTFSRSGSQDSHSESELAPDLPHDEKTDSPKKEISTPSPIKFAQQEIRAQVWEVSVEKPESLETLTKKGVTKAKVWSDDASSSKSSETVVETKTDYTSKIQKFDLSPAGLEYSEEISTPSKDVMLKSGESIDTESMLRSLESHEAEILQKSIDSNMSAETLHQSEFSTEADSAFLTGTDHRKDRLVKEKSMEDICSSGYDTDLSSAEFHATKLESERIDLGTFLSGSKPSADLSVLEKTIDEVKQSIEAAQVEILSEKSDGSSKYKQSPSEFQFKMLVSPDRPDVIAEEPYQFDEHSKEKAKRSDSQISDSSTKTSSHGEVTLSEEDKKTQVSIKETSPIPADLNEFSLKSDSGPHSILETESEIILSDADVSSKSSPEVKLRVHKHIQSRLGLTDRRSASEVEGWSGSSGSRYESFEHSESRPLSSDVDVMITAQSGGTDFQTALTSQELSSNSMRTSKDFYTAGSSLASRDSMKSLDSDASSHVASLDISDASETLVPSANELKEELMESSTYVEQFLHEGEKNIMKKSTDSIEGHIDLDVEADSNEAVSKMKRSHEMSFPPKDLIPESLTLDDVKEKNDFEEDLVKTDSATTLLSHDKTDELSSSSIPKSLEHEIVEESIEYKHKKIAYDNQALPFAVSKETTSERVVADIESEIIPFGSLEYDSIVKHGSVGSKASAEFIVKSSSRELESISAKEAKVYSEVEEKCEKKIIKEVSTVPFPVTKISSQRKFSDIENEIIPSEDILKSQSETSVLKSKVEHSSGLESKQSSTSSLRTQENQSASHTPFSGPSQSSLSTDNGREYVIDDMYDISETPELKSDVVTECSSRSEYATIEEKTAQLEQERESPTSEEFEVVDKPDEIDDFVVIEEVAKEAHEADPEGKSVRIISQKIVKRHDTEVEELLFKTSKKQESASSASESLSDEELLAYELEQKKLQAQELEEIEAGKRWVQMQFEGDPRYDYERVPLEDIKEEEMTDFDASRMGSLSSQKESVGSCGSFRNSYGSLSESEMASRIRFRVKGDSDEISISSLQEFENLEKALMEQYQQNSSSSQDSLNGSLPRRYILSRSQGDDISVSSLKEFEGLESACLEALKTEIMAKQKELLLNADPKEVSGFFLEKEKRSYSGSKENSPPQKGGSPSHKDGSPSQKGGSPLQKSGSPAQKGSGSPSQKLLSESANIRKMIDQQMQIEQKLSEQSAVTPKVITVKKFDDRGAYFVPEPDADENKTKEVTEVCIKSSTFVCSTSSKDGSAESLPGDCEEMMKMLDEEEKSTQEKPNSDMSSKTQIKESDDIENKVSEETPKSEAKAVEIPRRTRAHDFESNFSFTSDMSSSVASQQSDFDSLSTVVEKSTNKIVKSERSEELEFERGESQTRELSPSSGKDLVHGFGSGSGKQFTDPASGSWSCQDEDLSSSGSFSRGARENLMLGSTDSLEATSSNATRATYNYEVDTPMTGSLTSGAFPSPGSNTMVSSLDTLDPVTAVHMDSLEPASTEFDGQEHDSDVGSRTPRAKERTIMFDSTDTLSAVSGDSSVKEAAVETAAMTFYIGDTPIPRGMSPSLGESRPLEDLEQPVLSGSCPASLPPTSQPSPPIPAQRRSLTMLAQSPASSIEGSPKK